MIKCKACANFFKDDDIKECPNCGMELCKVHYEKHVKQCGNPVYKGNEDE